MCKAIKQQHCHTQTWVTRNVISLSVQIELIIPLGITLDTRIICFLCFKLALLVPDAKTIGRQDNLNSLR